MGRTKSLLHRRKLEAEFFSGSVSLCPISHQLGYGRSVAGGEGHGWHPSGTLVYYAVLRQSEKGVGPERCEAGLRFLYGV